MNPHPILRVLAILLLLAAPAVAGEGKTQFERWYQILLADQPAGWMHGLMLHHDNDNTIESRNEVQLTIRRGEVALEITMGSAFVETADGKPVRASMTQKLGAMGTQQE